MKYIKPLLSELVPSKYNPPQRVVKIKGLANNISENGLLQPITVANDLTIVDGHRRVMALKTICTDNKQGYDTVNVPAIQHNSDSHILYDKMFISANKDTMLLNGNQYLWRYMKGRAIPDNFLSRIKNIEKWVGPSHAKGMFHRILALNHSANTYAMCMGIYRTYTGKTSGPHMRKLAYYLLNVENCYRVKSSIVYFIPVDILTKSVDTRKKLKVNWNELELSVQ